jgi:tetratricopeptide (TPR) repeat protein
MEMFFYIVIFCITILLCWANKSQAAEDINEDAVITLFDQGTEYFRLRNYIKAKECFERVLAIFEKALGKEHPDMVTSLSNLGGAYYELGDYAKAKECLERALAICEKSFGEEDLDTAVSLNNLGGVYMKLGDHAKAKEYFERVHVIFEKLTGVEHLYTGKSLNNLGTAYDELGDYVKAKECIERGLSILEKSSCKEHPDTASPLSNLGTVYSKLGDYAKAKECYERVFVICEKSLGWKHPDTARSLNNLGGVYEDLGDYAKAKEYYERALMIREKSLDWKHPDTARSLNNLGAAYGKLGDYAKAKECHERAVAMHEKSLGCEHPETAKFFNNLGTAYVDLGDYAKAKKCYERALVIFEKLLGCEHPETARSLSNLGAAYGKLGDYAKEKECHERALVIRVKTLGEEHYYTAVSFSLFGDVCRNTGTNYAAIFYKKLAVNILQSVRGNLTGLDKGLQKSFVRSKEPFYHSLADLLAEQGRLSEAQQVLAMLKEDELFDFIRRDEKDDPRVTVASYIGLEIEKAKRFREIGTRLHDLTREKEELRQRGKAMPISEWNASDDAKRLSEIESDLKLAGEAFRRFLIILEKELEEACNKGHLKEFHEMNLANVRGFRGTLKDMGHGAVLIHTVIAETRVWVILTTFEIQMAVASTVSQSDIFKKILAFREDLENRRDVLPMAKELYDILIAPIARYLKETGAQTLMISLDGPLRYIPIAALHDGEGWLTEKYAIAIYTEAAKDKLIYRRDMAEWKAAAMGTTEEHPGFIALPAVKSELESIIDSIPGKILLNDDFTERAFSDALDDGFPVVHIASHFKFRPGTVRDSFLLLGTGDPLTLEDMRTGDFRFENVDQLTLSACCTAMGSGEWGGREVEGFGALAQTCGTKSIIATLWNVEDSSTGIFMSRFYNLIQQDGFTKAEAVRQAQCYFIKGKVPIAPPMESAEYAEVMPPDLKGYRHPYFWAPFILMGNWL